MTGSRGAGRPQRQARSGVTYKESNDDDDEFVPNAARLSTDVVGRRTSLRNSVVEVEELGIAKGKRTLTLKRARNVESLVSAARENVDGYAMPEAAPEEKSILPPGQGLQFPQVYEAAERVLNSHRRQSSAFECLLEAVSGASGDGEEEGGSSGQHSSAPKTTRQSESKVEQEEEMTSGAYDPELLAAYSAFERKLQAVKGVKEEEIMGIDAVERLAHSSDKESRIPVIDLTIVQGMKDTVITEKNNKREEDYKSSAEEKKYSRRGGKDKPNSMSSADAKKESKSCEEDKQDVVSSVDEIKASENGEQDKPYNLSSADEDEEDAEGSWNEIPDASDTENNSSAEERVVIPAPAKKPSQDLKVFAKSTNVSKCDPGTAGPALTPAKSTSKAELLFLLFACNENEPGRILEVRFLILWVRVDVRCFPVTILHVKLSNFSSKCRCSSVASKEAASSLGRHKTFCSSRSC